MAVVSNHIKALLIAEDITETSRVAQHKCLTLQHFDYKCQRPRNEAGEPYGATVSVTLNCTLRSTDDIRVFYDRLKSNAVFSYTCVFNAVFDAQKNLSDYEDAMIVTGYVIDVEEEFDSASGEKGDNEQMLVHVKILLSSITYVGRNNNKTLSIINVR